MWPTTRISASLLRSGQRRTSSCSGESLWRGRMPAPWRIRGAVGGWPGERQASQSLPLKRIGNFLRDASAAAHNLLWQLRGQTGTSATTILYLGRLGNVVYVSDWNERRVA